MSRESLIPLDFLLYHPLMTSKPPPNSLWSGCFLKLVQPLSNAHEEFLGSRIHYSLLGRTLLIWGRDYKHCFRVFSYAAYLSGILDSVNVRSSAPAAICYSLSLGFRGLENPEAYTTIPRQHLQRRQARDA